jgi:hypothetical protein
MDFPLLGGFRKTSSDASQMVLQSQRACNKEKRAKRAGPFSIVHLSIAIFHRFANKR